MWLRIVLAGLIGGVLLFCMGATNHMVFQLQGRTLLNMPDSETFAENLKARGLKHGLYVYPDMPTAAEQSDAAKMAAINERYKAGPSGMLLIAPISRNFPGEWGSVTTSRRDISGVTFSQRLTA